MEYCQLEGNLNGVHHVAASVVVCADLSRSVFLRGVKVLIARKVLADFKPAIETTSVVSKLKKRGETMKEMRECGDTVAYIDKYPVINSRRQSHILAQSEG